MALYSKAELAALIGKQPNWLSNYIGRKKIVVRADDKIDDKDPINKAFIEKWLPRKDTTRPVTVTDTVTAAPHTEQLIITAPPKRGGGTGRVLKISTEEGERIISVDEIPEYNESERLLKFLDTEKRMREAQKLELEIQKRKGEVVPVEPMQALNFQYKQEILTRMKMMVEAFINDVAHEYRLTPADVARYRGVAINRLNAAITDADNSFINGLETIVNNHITKRGVGERE